MFGWFENMLKRELFPDETDPLHDEALYISKLQAGYAYRLPVDAFNLTFGAAIAGLHKT